MDKVAEAIYKMNTRNDMVTIQLELKKLYGANGTVYVDYHLGAMPPYDISCVQISTGDAYVCYTDLNLVPRGMVVVERMEFRELVKRMRNSRGQITGICFNFGQGDYDIALQDWLINKILGL